MMTTIQKFAEALTAPEGELDVLNASENVIVMVDEAHRTQYGILGGRMSKALPNAVMVGFTGTPIEKDFKRSTIGRFGPLIDTYTIPQSVADGATVPIWYEARLPELAVGGAGGPWTGCTRPCLVTSRPRSRSRFAAATPTRRRSPRRSGASR